MITASITKRWELTLNRDSGGTLTADGVLGSGLIGIAVTIPARGMMDETGGERANITVPETEFDAWITRIAEARASGGWGAPATKHGDIRAIMLHLSAALQGLNEAEVAAPEQSREALTYPELYAAVEEVLTRLERLHPNVLRTR